MRALRAVMLGSVLAAGVGIAADRTDPGSTELHQKMMEGSEKMKAMKMSGDVDHDFLMSMKQHHLDGIAMAKVALQHAKDPKVRDFAQRTLDMQMKDAKELDAMMARHHKPAPQGRAAPR